MLKELDKTDLITGTALVLVAPALFPVLRDALKPLVLLGLRGAVGVVGTARTTFELAKEEVEDIVAEAQFERLKKEMDREIGAR
ncbi:Protein of unknown function DUF5132 [Acididesulfobacillus acetoxydans]|uniref:DUF5132 domain-containing protein n=1 Tax=Acididesulfobacillus acetoxydans TaxID=1561005 RepID=A0A8S0XAW0_9FIRM|nr:DUF5132 domain-containing protein [Acididesulfobacillus acetoxydans]CAA7600456.1 Protein of unknown function DUF5132 [Acididesulfobacillus acetoxydans]CEJ06590.1 Hypothetical protein DEACI_1039 [Acididesulfobacillus acetoxydans]